MDIIARTVEVGGALGLPNRQHSEVVLRRLYNRGLVNLVYGMQQHARLSCKILLGNVRKGYGDIPAWVLMPYIMPPYGTPMFEQTTVRLFLRKSFVAKVSFETLVYAIAHELAHIVLRAVNSPHRQCEKTTDVCAMLLGYEHMIVCGHRRPVNTSIDRAEPGWEQLFFSRPTTTTSTAMEHAYGYLADAEYELVAETIQHMRTQTA